ncbi:MAG: hypothetical protein SPJ13_01425 [Bacteroidales bacterium]|nr:hypothetical protein [Bacteroidales bacterium]
MRIGSVLILFLLTWPLIGTAQTDFWQQYQSLWSATHDEEALSDGLMEQMESLLCNPINVNDTLHPRLMEIPFITPLQCQQLQAYIQQNGRLYSLGELLFAGFDEKTVRLMTPFVRVEPVEEMLNTSIREMLTKGRHEFLAGTRRILETQRGNRDGSFRGDPYRCYLGYNYSYRNKLRFQLSAEQDAGERFVWNERQRGFDFYSFHIQVSDMGRLRSAIVGRYQLQFGQGLVLWSGYAPWSGFTPSVWRYGQGIRAASAFSEGNYLQGAAATVQLARHLEATLFANWADRDATLNRDSATVRSIYVGGLHRTDLEWNKRGLQSERLLGARLQYSNGNINLGVTAHQQHYSRFMAPYRYRYNAHDFRGTDNFVAGMDVGLRLCRWLFFAEGAFSRNGAFSALGGAQWLLAPGHTLAVLFRRYDTAFQNAYAMAFGRSEEARNEQGIFLSYGRPMAWGVKAEASADFFRFPDLRYRCYAPSHGSEQRLQLSKDFASRFMATLQYRRFSQGRNVTGDADYHVEQVVRQLLQCQLTSQVNSQWTLTTRLAYVHFQGRYEGDDSDRISALLTPTVRGCYILQEVTCHLSRLAATFRLVGFDAPDYDARLYAYENDLRYEQGNTLLYGKGVRAALLLRYNATERLSLGFKYGLFLYPGANVVGSGNTETQGNHRQDIKMQIRWVF